MKVEVVEKRVEPMMGSEFDLVLHIPKVIEKGASITCLLDSKTGFSELGGYIYSIIDVSNIASLLYLHSLLILTRTAKDGECVSNSIKQQ